MSQLLSTTTLAESLRIAVPYACAAVGGVFGGLRGHHKSKPKTEQVEVQTTGADPGKQKEYDKAKAACLTGRGYTVN